MKALKDKNMTEKYVKMLNNTNKDRITVIK